MPDIATTCPICETPFETKRGLETHLTRSGHRGKANAQAMVEALGGIKARAIPCPYPGCQASFRRRLGLKVHQTLLGHQPPRDSVSRGDGPPSEPRVHTGPRTVPSDV